jgi:NADP-dependent 3-hydroxy acid dehydrogenase YdfG
MYVRVRATIKQQSRHLMPSQSRGMPQRISLRIRDPVSFTGRDALVRVEPRLEQKLEHLDTIVPNCDREQATLIPTNVIRELAFGQTRAQPLQVVVRNSLAFAREGADVLISYLDEHEDAQETARLVKDAGRKAILASGDIQDYRHCEQLVEQSFDKLGGLDILINNAAFQMTHESIEELTPEEWDKTFKTNIYAMFYLTRAALPRMREGSAIVNTASVQAYQPSPTLLAYSATKGAIVTFTKSLSALAIKQGVRVNAAAPGPVWTPLSPRPCRRKK